MNKFLLKKFFVTLKKVMICSYDIFSTKTQLESWDERMKMI